MDLLTVFGLWLIVAFVVGGLIQVLKTDWLSKAPTWLWKISTPVIAVGVSFLRYADEGIWLILFNALGVYVTTFLFYDLILKKVSSAANKAE